ncbi:MAG: hypothetical protein HZB33_03355, partial [Nitrospirae bacterium]|nr:hypothetical protein [Nitrospirota bacterium]
MQTEAKDHGRIRLAGYLIAIGFVVLLMRLWQLQVIQGAELLKVSVANRLRVFGVPAPRGIIYDRNGIPLVKNTPYFCVSLIPEEFDSRTLPGLSRLLNLPEEELARKIERKGQSPFTPTRLKQGLSLDEVSFIEARRSDFPGLIIEIEVSREYIYGSVGAHVIGYLGRLTPAQSGDPS